jgi:hypothetical protein
MRALAPLATALLALAGQRDCAGGVAAARTARAGPHFARHVHRARILREHEHRLAAHVGVLVIVAAILGRDQAVSDEHDLGAGDVHLGLEEERAADEILVELPDVHVSPDAERCARDRRDADQRTCLDIRAVGVAGTERPRAAAQRTR